MSTLRFILRKIFLILSGLTVLLPLALSGASNPKQMSELADVATVFGASSIGALVILYILEIEKKK